MIVDKLGEIRKVWKMNKSQLAILKRHAEVHGDTDLLWLVEQAEKAEVYLTNAIRFINTAIENLNE